MSIHPTRDAGAAVFRNRHEAGRVLSELLSAYQDHDDQEVRDALPCLQWPQGFARFVAA